MARRRRPPRSGALTELPPLKILGQIAALQAIFYVAALVLMLFSTLVAGTKFTLDLVLGWSAVRGDTTQGWLVAFLWILDGGLFVALGIVLVVIRSKLVLDFALTVHFLHLLVVSLYTGQIPRNASWWAAMALSSALAVMLGMWGCRYRELRPISFGGSGGGGGQGGGTTAANGVAGNGEGSSNTGEGGSGSQGDEEQGFSRGRGRGRGRDGAGEYEMVKMNGEAAP